MVDGSGVLVKLAGDVRLDPATGQITTVFDNLPQVPFTSFALSFQGGPRAVLSNPTTCGEKALTAVAHALERDRAEDRERDVHDRPGLHGGRVRSRARGSRPTRPPPGARPAR